MSTPESPPRDDDAARRRLVALLSAADAGASGERGGRAAARRRTARDGWSGGNGWGAVGPAPGASPRVAGAGGGEAPGASPRVPGALEAAAARYADAYGTLPGPEPERRRTRWRVAPRTVAAAALALVLVAGGVALRATLSAPGEPVELPVPRAGAGAVPAEAAGGAGGPADAPAGGPGVAGTDAAAAGASPPVPPGSAGAEDGAEVVVDVAGAVERPGVVTLPVGARVVDAIAAAGGALPDADLARLNLARVLVDGEQVVVTTPDDPLPVPPASGQAPGGSGADGDAGGGAAGLVNLNTADEAALDALPGIGPVLAARVLEHRTAHPFASVEDLEDVPGIGPALMAELRTLVTV